ncbi:MAG: hypothetical protein WKF59_02390 [Chitinophagaceae bacterium]
MNDAVFDKEININAADIEPMITYGTNPGLRYCNKWIDPHGGKYS